MRSIKFIFGVLFSFVLIGVIYFVIVDQYIIYKREIPKRYQQVLLESLSDYKGKVIIIGGSDAHHGINAQMLEEMMHRPVINFGDNGGYPYKHYIYNLEKYAKEGDIVVANMAWPILFQQSKLDNEYVDTLIDEQVSNHFYYRNLPFIEKVKLVFIKLPYQKIIKIIFSRPDDSSRLQYQIDNMEHLLNLIKNNEGSPRGGSFREGPEDINVIAESFSCDQY